MKANRWRIMAAIAATAALMAACGSQQEKETVAVNEVQETVEEPEVKEKTEPETESEEEIVLEEEEEVKLDEYHPNNSLAPNRTFFYDGEEIPMPCKVRDFEPLAGKRIKELYGDGVLFHLCFHRMDDGEETSEVVVGIDTSEIREFDQNQSIHLCVDNAEDAELMEKFLEAPIMYFSLHNFMTAPALQENISILPDKTLFHTEDDADALIEEIASCFGGERSEKCVKVDRFEDGYSMEWYYSVLDNGSQLKSLVIDYVPEACMAYYAFINDEKQEDSYGYYCSDLISIKRDNSEEIGWYGSEEEEEQNYGIGLGDVTGDGIDELLLFDGAYSYVIWLDKESKALKVLEKGAGEYHFTLNNIWTQIIRGDDGGSALYKYYLFDSDGKKSIITMTCESGRYYVSGREIPEEEYRSLEGRMGALLHTPYKYTTYREIEKLLRDSSEAESTRINSAHKDRKNGEVVLVEDMAEYLLSDADDWKQIYKEWLLLNDDGSNYILDQESTSFCFMDWDGIEAPILGRINSGTQGDLFTVLNGEVVYIGYTGRIIGYSYLVSIQGTDYYFSYYDESMGSTLYNGCLYKVGNPREIIWKIFWEEIDEEYPVYMDDEGKIEYVPEYGEDNPDCEFRGEQMSKQDAMDEVDKLLGDHAAEQLIEVLKLQELYKEAEGPLSFVGNIWDSETDIYTWDQVMEILDTP